MLSDTAAAREWVHDFHRTMLNHTGLLCPLSPSPLSGIDLVRAKVKLLAWMGGKYPSSSESRGSFCSLLHNSFSFKPECFPSTDSSGPEWNFSHNGIGNSTAYVYNNWPSEVPIAFSGFELGVDVQSGGIMTKDLPVTNPCRKAYIDFNVKLAGFQRCGIPPLAYAPGPPLFFRVRTITAAAGTPSPPCMPCEETRATGACPFMDRTTW